MKICRLKKEEIEEVLKIIKNNYPKIDKKHPRGEILEMFGDALIKPKYLVVKEKSKIIGIAGYMQSYEDYNIYELFWVNVKKEFQGKGIGTELVNQIIKEIKKLKGEYKKALLIELSVTDAKSRFYKKFGFKVIKRLRKKDCIMALQLTK